MVLGLLGLLFLLGYGILRGVVYWRWRSVPTEEEVGAWMERELGRRLTGFRVRSGKRNGVKVPERTVYLTPPVYRGRSVYHLAVAGHELGHVIQWRERPETIRAAQGLLTAGLGFLFLGFLLSPGPVGAGAVLLGYSLVAATYAVERDATARALAVVPGPYRKGVAQVAWTLTASYLVVPSAGVLWVAGWMMAAP